MSVEKFVKGEGPYTFFVEMSDSTASYDFDLYTRVDAPADSLRKLAALPLQVTWTSPTFHVFREEVYLPMDGKMSLFSKQVWSCGCRTRRRACAAWAWSYRETRTDGTR